MRIPKKHLITSGLIWLACIIVFSIADLLLLAPGRRQQAAVEKQLGEVKKTYHSALQAAQQETQLAAKKELEQLRDELGRFVVDSEDPGNLIFDISEMANEKKLGSFSIKTMEQQGEPEQSPLNHICENRIALSFTCNFDQFANFLNGLERHRPVVFIDQLRFRRAKAADKDHKVDMELTTFVRRSRES